MPASQLSPEEASIGLKLAWLIAGFFGAVISLSFVRELTKEQAVISVLTGVVTTYYATPAIVYYCSIPKSPEALSHMVAFLTGLTAMNVIPGVLKLSEYFKRDPFGFVRRIVDLAKRARK